MRLMTGPAALAALLAVGATLAAPAPDEKSDAEQAKADVAAFKAYLEKNHAGKKWQTGPARIDSEEIRKAYPGQRFYFVFSAPPLPPGAPLPDVLKRYRERVEEFRRDYITLTVRFDAGGTIAPLRRPEDYNAGLMKVASDDDARTAAAAIAALHGQDRVGPGAVAAREVSVVKNDKGWTCSVNRKQAFLATVGLDPAGRCTRVAKMYAGPLPP